MERIQEGSVSTQTKGTYIARYGVDAIAALPPIASKPGVQRACIAQYELIEGQSLRAGDVDVVEVNNDGGIERVGSLGVGVGVLDLELMDGLLGGACADGKVRFMKVGCEDGNEGDGCGGVVGEVEFGAGMILSIGSGCRSGKGKTAAVTGSKGEVGLIRTGERGGEVLWEAEGHGGFEAWCGVYDGREHSAPSSHGLVYSGGDDGWLKVWDSEGRRVGGVKNAHGGVGVVTVDCLREWELVSGGYDDFVRGWDIRKLKHSVNEVSVGGGAWRVIQAEEGAQKGRAVIACMYNGFKVVDLLSWNVFDTYGGHGSIAYGAAWLSGLDSGTVITGSFYDKAIHVWQTSAT